MKTLLAGAHLLKLEKIIQQSDAITVVMSSKQVETTCPSCQCIARKIHIRYERKLADLPWESIAVRIRLRVRRFFCRNDECQQLKTLKQQTHGRANFDLLRARVLNPC